MEHTPLRVAIVGTGMIGAVHRRAARDAGADVVGVLGSSPSRSADFAERWGTASAYGSFEQVLADRPDVVQICTPNGSHHDYALRAIRAGLNVVCEKPLAITASEALELVEAVEAAGVVATIPFAYRYHPLVRELRARRIAGEFGDIHLVHGSYLQDWLLDPLASSWRVDAALGGPSRAFADVGSHWCDLAEFISGERFTAVSAVTTIAYPTRPAPSGPSFGGAGSSADAPRLEVTTEDTATATFRTASGGVGNTVISQVSAGRKNRLWVEVDGSRGSAVFDQEAPETVWLGHDRGSTILNRGEGDVSSDQARLNLVPAGHPMGYRDAFSAFLADTYAAVRGEAPDGLPTFADGLRAARIIDAVLESASSSSWVDIQED
ncbi:dehydrogenase [Frondihabitans sucicola]|uniref:Dehydrogenase n=1 Tax=Frondihabitans sucicola TaxID=1268041 RepID=A0ABN6Y3U7_9MICO|nr:Gfo/Idh/MocA family oxidoreductase [Frondihabitans sucicola]BDZ52015.1 dehydrogenase [Frondihabitans sucicola]